MTENRNHTSLEEEDELFDELNRSNDDELNDEDINYGEAMMGCCISVMLAVGIVICYAIVDAIVTLLAFLSTLI